MELTSLLQAEQRMLEFVRKQTGLAAVNYAATARDEALGDGRLSKDDLETVLRVGARSQRLRDVRDTNVDKLPIPPYSFEFSSAGDVDLLREAAEWIYYRIQRESPVSSNQPKSHPYHYRESLDVIADGSVRAGPRNLGDLSRRSVVSIVNYAPHASTIEHRRNLMINVTRAAQAFFGPSLGIAFRFEQSDTLLGRTYGPGTGGPAAPGTKGKRTNRRPPVPYALPVIDIGLPGVIASGFRIRRRRRGAQGVI